MAKSPDQIAGLVEWWDPDDIAGGDGASVSSWTGSQNSLVLSQGTAAQRPELMGTTRQPSGHQMVYYETSAKRLATTASEINTTTTTYVMVYLPDIIALNGWQFTRVNSGNPYAFRMRNNPDYQLIIARDGSEGSPNTVGSSSYLQRGIPQVLSARYDGTTLSIRANGVEIGSDTFAGTLDTDTFGGLTLGNHPSSNSSCKGMIGDFVVYDSGISLSDLAELEDWLIDRWNIDDYWADWADYPGVLEVSVGGSETGSPCIRELDANTWIMFAVIDNLQVDYWTAPKADPHNWTRNANGVIIDASTDSPTTCRAVSAVLDGSTWHILVDDTGSFYHFSGTDLQSLTDNGQVFAGQGTGWETAVRHPYIATTKVGDDWAVYYDGRDNGATSGFGAIGVVYTADFATFTERQQVLDVSALWFEATDVGAPAVWRREGKWEMVYAGFDDNTRTDGKVPHYFGLAHSDDGTTWTKIPEQVPIFVQNRTAALDTLDAINTPELFDDGTGIFLYYLARPGIGINAVEVGQAFLDSITPTPPPSGGGNRMGGDRAIRRSPVGR